MTRKTDVPFIKESLQLIFQQLDATPKAKPNNEVKTSASKIYKILLEKNSPAERFYFIYLICQLSSNVKPVTVDKMMQIILPAVPTPQSLELISDLISFAICHPQIYSKILDHLSQYVILSETVDIDVESWAAAESLATDSPSFCSALLSRSDLSSLGIERRLLAKWLQELSKVEHHFTTPSLHYLISYSLFDQTKPNGHDDECNKIELINSDFHFGLLTLIQSKKCQNLTNQYMIEVVSKLSDLIKSAKLDEAQVTSILDRFGQILSVAASSKVITLTNALRTALAKLDSNQLISSLMKWQNK